MQEPGVIGGWEADSFLNMIIEDLVRSIHTPVLVIGTVSSDILPTQT